MRDLPPSPLLCLFFKVTGSDDDRSNSTTGGGIFLSRSLHQEPQELSRLGMGVLLVDPGSLSQISTSLHWLILMKKKNQMTTIRERLLGHAGEFLGDGWSHLAQTLAASVYNLYIY